MVKSCIYCKIQLDDNIVFDVCKRCGLGVWGEQMYNAIIQNMTKAKDSGDLYQGSVTTQQNTPSQPEIQQTSTNTPVQPTTPEPSLGLQSLTQEAMENKATHEIQKPKEQQPLSAEDLLTPTPEIKKSPQVPENKASSW